MAIFGGDDEATICALSTPPGRGGIAVVRVSGKRAAEISSKVCSFLAKKLESHRVYYGFARQTESPFLEIDEVLATYFAPGRSFTGEETIEISCHGGTALTTQIIHELIKSGCRMAGPGEFTYRAFMNGRIDLVQAESVLSLIESESDRSARVALRQLRGDLSKQFTEIEDGLVWILAQLEASIDFSTEGIDFLPSQQVLARAQQVLATCEQILATYSQGRVLADGITMTLVGRPNVGKSSLLNALVGEERAIVTEVPGTTRDTVEGRFFVDGVSVRVVDTAGLRETEDRVEKIGIERARQEMRRSDLVVHVFDATDALTEQVVVEAKELFEQSRSQNRHHLLILNKADVVRDNDAKGAFLRQMAEHGLDFPTQVLWLSAKTGEGVGELRTMVRELLIGSSFADRAYLTQARHYEGLKKIHSCVQKAIRLISEDESPEFICFELQDAVRNVHELLGKQFDEQVISRIFKEFCLGK